MKRCNRESSWHSWFNGFRMCKEHYDEYPESERLGLNQMVKYPSDLDGPAGPCDVPIETRSEFWARHDAN